MDRRRFLMSGLPGLAALGLAGQIAPAFGAGYPTSGPTLKDSAAAKGLVFGCAVRSDLFTASPDYTRTVSAEARIGTPEYELKWNILRPAPGQFDFTSPEKLLKLSTAAGLALRGHTLVWHEANPDWLVKEIATGDANQLLTEHVDRVVTHFDGRIKSWDVVNEVVEPKDGREDGLRRSIWLDALGPDYIPLAFRTAAAASPDAMLFYNEYGLEFDTPEHEARRKAVLQLLETLRDTNVPIHGFGLQGHLQAKSKQFNPQVFADFLKQVAAFDLKIVVTELDVSDDLLPADIPKRDQAVADAGAEYLNVCLAEPAVMGVITWGVADGVTWLDADKWYHRKDGLPQRCLAFDKNYARKPLWGAIAAALNAAPARPAAFPF